MIKNLIALMLITSFVPTAISAQTAVDIFESDALGECLGAMIEFRHPAPTETGLRSGNHEPGLKWCSITFAAEDANAVTARFDEWAEAALDAQRFIMPSSDMRVFESHMWREPVLEVSLKPVQAGGVTFLARDLDKEA